MSKTWINIDNANIVCFLCLLASCLLRLIGEAIGWGNTLFMAMPFLWLSPSLGFFFTSQVVFKGLEVYSIILIWLKRSLSRPLHSIASGNWRASVNWNSLILLSLLALPIRDMVVRWDIVHHRWAIGFPQYAQMLLHVDAVLYIVFIIIQGVYLVAVSTNTQVVGKYSCNEQVQKYVLNLILVNIGLLIYDIMWIMTTLAIEGGEHYLLKLVNLGCVGLVLYDIFAVVALVNLWIAISPTPISGNGHADPSKTIAWLQKLIPIFLFLSISREFNSLIFPSSLNVILPVLFLALGSLVFALEIHLLHRWLFTSLRLSTKKQPTCKISVSSVLMALLSIHSCLVNACQGYDSYQRWLSNKHPAFTAFLAVYCTIYTLHIAYEGFLLVWHLSHPRCEPGESINRRYLTVLSTCVESSTMFAIYQVLVVICLPDAGMNLATFARVSGPLAFHISTVIAYNHLKDKWSQSQAQEVPSSSHPVAPALSWNLYYIQRCLLSASSALANCAYALPALLPHVIRTLRHRVKEVDKPEDAPIEPKGHLSDPVVLCVLTRWVPVKHTGVLLKVAAWAAVLRLVVHFYNFEGDWIAVVAYRILLALILAVINYYLYRSSTKHLVPTSQRYQKLWRQPIHILYIVAVSGIAEVVYSFYCQWTAEGDGIFLLDFSLTIASLMKVALIIHENILIISIVSLDFRVEDKHCNLKQGLQLAMHLNLFYAVFGAFSSFLAWLVTGNGSLTHLLGHLTCAILVPTMASWMLKRLYNAINKDLQSNEIGTNKPEEEGSSELECISPSPPAKTFKQEVRRHAEE